MKFGFDVASSFSKRANLITFILSNDFDYLILQLKRQLYAKSNILTRKLLVVPGDEPLKLFEKSCLEDPSIGLNFGYRAINLNLAVEVVAKTIFPQIRFPRKKALRQRLLEILLKKTSEDDPKYQNIKKYLDSQQVNLNFFDTLASNLSTTSITGMVSEVPEELSWQKDLLDELASFFDWPKDIFSLNDADLTLAAGLELHFFGLSMIPTPYLEFFKKISKLIPCFFYLPTPTRVLALDFISDGSEKSVLDSSLKNHLIANFQVGLKPLIKFFIDESSFQYEEFFLGKTVLSEECSSEEKLLSLKEALLSSLLDARVNESKLKQKVRIKDDLLIVKAPNPFREVEEAIEKIKFVISNFKIKFDEIAIISPNLKLYAPLLVYHFERNGLPYRIDSHLFLNESNLEVSSCLNLIQSRFCKRDLIGLLDIQTIMTRLGFTDKEVHSLKRVLQNSSITFGYDQEHRLAILKNCNPKDLYTGTVSHFFDQIYLAAVFSEDQLKSTSFGSGGVVLDNRLLECLGLFHHVLKRINEIRNEILNKSHTIKNFFKIFIDFLSEFFEEEIIFDLRLSFQDELEQTLDVEYSGEIFLSQLLEKFEERKQGSQSKEFSKISCLDFKEGSYLGKKFIYVLGADESSLPKIQETNRLDLSLQESQITPLQMQKGAFLHLIGLNSPYLYFSYSEVGFDKKDKILSLYVEKLIQYLDLFFESEDGKTVSSQIIHSTHENSYDKERFTKIHFDNKSFDLYEAVMSKKSPVKHLKIQHQENTEKINLRDLELLLKNPVRFFVKNTLKMHLPFDDDKKEFDLPSYKRKSIIFSSLAQEIEKYFDQLKFRGNFPQYIFGEFYESEIKNETERFHKKILEVTRSTYQMKKFTLKSAKTHVEKIAKNKYLLPAIKVELNCGKSVEIEGTITELFPGVLVLPQEIKQDGLFQFWPKILAYSYCSKLFQEREFKIIGIDSKEIKISNDDCLDGFKDLVEYAILAQKQISFFYDSSIKKQLKILLEDDSLDESILRKKETDPYFQFFELSDADLNVFSSLLKKIYDSQAKVLYAKGKEE